MALKNTNIIHLSALLEHATMYQIMRAEDKASPKS